MNRRKFLKSLAIVPAVIVTPSVLANIPKRVSYSSHSIDEIYKWSDGTERLYKESPKAIMAENPKTVDELISCIDKYTKKGATLTGNHLTGNHLSSADSGVGSTITPTAYALGAYKGFESHLVPSMWATIRDEIKDGNQTMFWRRLPEISKDDFFDNEGKSKITCRYALYPLHTTNEWATNPPFSRTEGKA